MLRTAGFKMVPEVELAENAIINTCGFIRSAVEENIAAILDLVELKSSGNLKRVGVVGCLVSRYGEELSKNIPEVDFWARCEEHDVIMRALSADTIHLECNRSNTTNRYLLQGVSRHVRYLKISEGCNNSCSYCTIPSIKGALRSRPIDVTVKEAMDLVRDGAREICLIAQDLTAYGDDRGESHGLITLLDELESSLPVDVWLRMLYLQPYRVDRKLLERVANGRQVLPYLDIPIQHSSHKILNLMNRGSDPEDLFCIFETARAIRSDFALRTTCMIGFPGESRADFDDLLRFIERVRFDRVGAFVFSPEEGTPASSLPGQVAERTKTSRLERLMSLQEEISLSRQMLFVGKEMDVLIDSIDECGEAEGRSYREAPDVDGLIELRISGEKFCVGDKVRVVITDAYEHDLTAEPVYEHRPGA
jgi:ribosomal protein S12 methylthiotransferase